MAEDKTGYEVGYGRPPRKTRFQPGHSGNPRAAPAEPETSKPTCVRS